MRLLAFLQSLVLYILPILGNVEKTIFLGPEAVQLSEQQPSLEQLHLERLSHSRPTLRRELPAAFPKPNSIKGKDAWFLLDGLRQHQRYEVRICWAATVSTYAPAVEDKSIEMSLKQPTSFTLATFTLSEAFETQSIITSLAVYSDSRQGYRSVIDNLEPSLQGPESASILFLRVQAAADYFTTNKTLMQNVPPVIVDISKSLYFVDLFVCILMYSYKSSIHTYSTYFQDPWCQQPAM